MEESSSGGSGEEKWCGGGVSVHEEWKDWWNI